MVYGKKDLKFCVKPTGGLLLWDKKTRKKTNKFGTKISNVPIFDTSLFLRGFQLTSYNFRKKHTLDHTFFGMLQCCTSKYYDSWADQSMGKGETRGLLQKLWWGICLKLPFCVPKFLKDVIFGTNKAKKSINLI